ncbi:mechanosensitive ion channel family protein [Spongiibacter sp. KMU-158]|uniref:Mechanosensitive ion channel family protein n=1 Tax=Spongiibacter pelagi TaxID=2760804 RepID=A0A927C3E2_9GAMM|nr:mechanosensitive ion channel family protein [Spongiibacter pelagi]MBD2859092.1 mechanosensitive ion channel family protein [Spongiibacter pelagi]
MSQSWLGAVNLSDYPWLGEVFVVVLIALFANLLAGRLLLRLAKRFEKTHNLWDDALLEASRRPIILMIWAVGASHVLEIIDASSDAPVFAMIDPLRSVAVVAIIIWFLVSLIRQVEERLLSEDYTHNDEPIDRTTVMALGKLMRSAVIIVGSLMMLQNLGYSVSGVLAFGGIGGIAVGFAAKDLLANFFGGLMVYLDRPFSVGDWVRSPDKNIEGTVENIGWRQTRIRTFDQRPLYVPNSTFAQISVENPSRMLNRRIYETIGLRYEDARLLPAVIADVKAMLQEHPAIDLNKTMIVNFNAYGPSSLDFFVYTFTKTTVWVEYHEIKQDVLLKILDIIHRHGADVAYPTQTLKLDPVELIQNIEGGVNP